MNNNYKVTSYELSSRLKELGVPQTSEHYWEVTLGSDSPNGHITRWDSMNLCKDDPCLEHFSAYDTAELGKMLPYAIITEKRHTEKFMVFEDPRRNLSKPMYTDDTFADYSEAEARGLMLEYLITNNHIKVEDITL